MVTVQMTNNFNCEKLNWKTKAVTIIYAFILQNHRQYFTDFPFVVL